jgi:hypothetical protein
MHLRRRGPAGLLVLLIPALAVALLGGCGGGSSASPSSSASTAASSAATTAAATTAAADGAATRTVRAAFRQLIGTSFRGELTTSTRYDASDAPESIQQALGGQSTTTRARQQVASPERISSVILAPTQIAGLRVVRYDGETYVAPKGAGFRRLAGPIRDAFNSLGLEALRTVVGSIEKVRELGRDPAVGARHYRGDVGPAALRT